MIKSLHIENIAVIEKTNIDFDKGFNVLTGETGAGKSIIIDAINAVLGERTSKELIRAGCDKAVVSALFTDLSCDAKNTIINNGFELDDGDLLITRTLSLSGGSIKINGRPATATVLKEIAKKIYRYRGVIFFLAQRKNPFVILLVPHKDGCIDSEQIQILLNVMILDAINLNVYLEDSA